MDRGKAKQIVFSALEKNVTDLRMQDEKISATLEELGVDSLDVMLILMDISSEADVDISDDQAEVLDTPEKIIEFIVDNKLD